jgi:hypothetical protein
VVVLQVEVRSVVVPQVEEVVILAVAAVAVVLAVAHSVVIDNPFQKVYVN